MKIIVWVMSIINLYVGLHFFLNVIGYLGSSKYSKTATLVFAILFLAMSVLSFYFLFKTNIKLALLIGLGPWILALLFLLFNMMTSDYK